MSSIEDGVMGVEQWEWQHQWLASGGSVPGASGVPRISEDELRRGLALTSLCQLIMGLPTSAATRRSRRRGCGETHPTASLSQHMNDSAVSHTRPAGRVAGSASRRQLRGGKLPRGKLGAAARPVMGAIAGDRRVPSILNNSENQLVADKDRD